MLGLVDADDKLEMKLKGGVTMLLLCLYECFFFSKNVRYMGLVLFIYLFFLCKFSIIQPFSSLESQDICFGDVLMF